MFFFLFIHAEVQVPHKELQKIQETEEEIKHVITGKKKKAKIMPHLKLASKPKCPSRYGSAEICILQGGVPPSNDTTAADMRGIHDEVKQQPDRPLTVACRHSHDVFESPNLRDPTQERRG